MTPLEPPSGAFNGHGDVARLLHERTPSKIAPESERLT